jgi:hypothetical protein
MVVRLRAPTGGTFLCADNGRGKSLYNGTLTGFTTLRARHVRLNIGLASTSISVNGRSIALNGSPTGLDITHARGVRPLALGDRPCA